MRANGLLSENPRGEGSTLNSDLPLEEKILLEKSLDFVSEKDQIGPTTDLFFHELVDNETHPKRVFEKIVGFFGFIFFLLTLPIFALLIFITSGKPIFKTDTILGYRGSKVKRYLYRTKSTSNKNKTTLIGKFLLATGLYKLPNSINILNGDMALVGPKVLPIDKSETLNKQFTDFYKRYATKPGVIGIQNGQSWDLEQDFDELSFNLQCELKYLVYPTLKKDYKVLSGSFEKQVQS